MYKNTNICAVFVADVSGSMMGEPLNNLKKSLREGQKYIGQDNLIGLVSYSDDVNIDLPIAKFNLTQRAMFAGAVDDLQAGGSTATFDAIAVAMKMIEDQRQIDPNLKPMIFVLSDGETNRGHSLDDIRSIVQELGIPIYTIGYNAEYPRPCRRSPASMRLTILTPIPRMLPINWVICLMQIVIQGGIKMAITMEVPKDPATKKEVLGPFSMEVPDEAVIKHEVQEQVKPVPEEVARLQAVAESNVAAIMTLDIDEFAKRKDILQSIESFGKDSMKRSAKKNSLLQVTVGKLSKDGDEGGLVAKGLMDLHRELEDLDPSLIDFTRTGILGKLFDPIRSYFAKYQKADAAIADIIVSLDKGETTLKNDNTTLEIEQQAMRDLTKKLMKEIELGTLMDESIEKQIEAARARNEDPEKVKFVTEEVLFPLRQTVYGYAADDRRQSAGSNCDRACDQK